MTEDYCWRETKLRDVAVVGWGDAGERDTRGAGRKGGDDTGRKK